MTEHAHEHARRLLAQKIEAKIAHLSSLLYDTQVTPARLFSEALPYLADDIYFKDPWQEGGGIDKYKLGMKGFHSMFYFNFDTYQTTVTLEEKKPGYNWLEGRAMIDGTMNLRQFSWLFTYPLRTILVYKFRLFTDSKGFGHVATAKDSDIRFEIYFHEEMWSFGGILQQFLSL